MQQSEVTSATSKAICPQGNSPTGEAEQLEVPTGKNWKLFLYNSVSPKSSSDKIVFFLGLSIYLYLLLKEVCFCLSFTTSLLHHFLVSQTTEQAEGQNTCVLIAHQQSMTLIGIYVAIGLATRTLRHVLWFQSKSCLMCGRINSEFITITIYHATVTGICLWGFYCMEASLVSSEVGWKNDRCVP